MGVQILQLVASAQATPPKPSRPAGQIYCWEKLFAKQHMAWSSASATTRLTSWFAAVTYTTHSQFLEHFFFFIDRLSPSDSS